ncbi:ubiquitin carboxyl-terminal hydrolase 38 [Arapaima gigas]
MDKILEALVGSSHPASVKKAIVRKVVEAAEKEVTEEQCGALYNLATRLILLGEDTFQRQVGVQVLEAYARCHRAQFECFFTKEFVVGLLQQGYGNLDRKDPAIFDYIHSCLRLLISCPSVLEIFGVVQVEVLRVVCERSGPAMCARLSTMLLDFVQCIPKDKSAVIFCQQLLRTIAYFHCASNQERELQEYVSQVTKVSTLLQSIWKSEPATLLPSLQEVFAIISSTDPSFEPSIALASLVQHIPLQMITVLIKSLTTDRNVKDASMTQALCRMIDWLSWPLVQYVDTWVIALLKGLAAVQKFTILIDVTLLKIELVFSRLWYPVVRQGALVVLSHMLLSFQHCPEAFHLVVPQVVNLVQSLKSDGLPNSKTFLLQFTELIHCMMYQFSGFPDLYENILEAIKKMLDPPPPSKIKQTFFCLTGGCFMYLSPSLSSFRRQVLSQQLSGSNTLMKKLQLLFAFLAHTQRAAYAPRSFFDASRPPWFTAGSQQDCSEYLRFLLDSLHEEEKTIQAFKLATPRAALPKAGDTDTSITSHSSDTQAHIVEAKGDRKTLVEKLFRGKLCTGIRCLQCNSISEKDEPFTDLSLAFYPPAPQELKEDSLDAGGGSAHQGSGPANKSDETSDSPKKERPTEVDGENRAHNGPGGQRSLSIPDLINYFLAPEILDEENKYYCEHCMSLQRAEKTLRVLDTPEYLILTLLRFSYDASCHVRRKILDSVSIPLLILLPTHHRTALCSSPSPLEVDSPDSGENLAKKLKPSGKEEGQECKEEAGTTPTAVESVPYVLCSVVMHSGMSSESGHYYCYCRNVNGVDQGEEPQDDSLTDPGLQTCFSVVKQEELGVQPPKEWFLFNDSRVTFTSFQSVQSVTSRFPKDTAYVLVYRKQNIRNSGGPGTASRLRLTAEPPLHKDLMDAITKDNKLFLQEQELSARTQALQAASCSFRPNGFDDNDPPGSCGPSGGGGGGGFNTISRLVF